MLNQCQFIGNVGQDPEIRSTQDGSKVANLSIGVTDKWKNKSGEKQEKTEWVRVVIWGSLAGVVEQYVKKGSKVFISGKMQTRKWTDQQGVEKYSTEIVLQGFGGTLIMLDGKRGGQNDYSKNEYGQVGKADAQTAASDGFDDDIPFAFVLPLIGSALTALTKFPGVI